jgi:hypothetical protein
VPQAPGGTASIAPVNGFSVSNTQVTVNLTNVSNAQTLTINLLGVVGGAKSGDVAIPMSVLLGDVNATGRTDSGDVTITRQQTVSQVNLSNFRLDVNCTGRIDAGDVTVVRNSSVTALP